MTETTNYKSNHQPLPAQPIHQPIPQPTIIYNNNDFQLNIILQEITLLKSQSQIQQNEIFTLKSQSQIQQNEIFNLKLSISSLEIKNEILNNEIQTLKCSQQIQSIQHIQPVPVQHSRVVLKKQRPPR